MNTEATYGGPQGIDTPISREGWGAAVEASSENVVVPLKNPGVTAVDSDHYLMVAKNMAIDNYNNHRNAEHSVALTADDTNVVSFAKTVNWRVTLTAPAVRGLLWEITYDGQRNEIHLDTYRKVHHSKRPLKES